MCGGFVGDVFDTVGDAVGDVVDFVGDEIIDPVVDFGETFVKSLGQGVEDLFEGDLDEVLRNPAVITVASFAFPQYAAYINLGAKAATGQEITPTDLASAGLQGYADLKGVRLPAGTEKAVVASAQIAEGKDPVQALASTYGSNFAKELGLDTRVNQALASTVGEEYANRITNNIDINRAAADYAAGNSTERILANQYGDDLVSYLGASTPTQQAFGYAGIETALQKAEGASDEDALLAGAKTYYNRGGALPDLNNIASLAGIQDFNIDLNDVIGDLNLNFPDLKGLGYDLPSLSGLGIDLNQFNFDVSDILNTNLSLPEISGLGIDLGDINFEGIDYDYLRNKYNMNLRDLKLEGIDIGQLGFDPDIDIGLSSFDVADVDLPSVEVPEFDIPNVTLPDIPLPGIRPVDRGEPVEMAGLDIANREALTQQAEEEEIPISELLLRDFQLKNPLLKA